MDSLSLHSLSNEGPSRDPVELLPRDASWRIFSFVPVDLRLLLNAVCRSWRAALGDPSVWHELDFSRSTRRVTREMIHAALRCARVQLRSLNVDLGKLPFETLLEVLEANAFLHTLQLHSLPRALFPGHLVRIQEVHALLAAAPRLHTLECSITGELQAVLPLLRNTLPQYGNFTATHVRIEQTDELARVDVLPLAAAASAHDGLQHLHLSRIPLSVAELNAIVDAASWWSATNQRNRHVVSALRSMLSRPRAPGATDTVPHELVTARPSSQFDVRTPHP